MRLSTPEFTKIYVDSRVATLRGGRPVPGRRRASSPRPN